MSIKPPIIKILPNGLRIAIVSNKYATTATASILIGTGSAFETPKQNGLSHFLEHMCFKGTTRRPNAKVISEEIESLGAITNAFTDREYTGYYIKGNPAHLDTFLDILFDIYQNSTLPQKEIDKEAGVIIEEINMYEDMPQYKVSEILSSLMYPKHAVGRSILGTKKTVSSFKHKDFASYKDKFYTASNTTIILAGDVSVSRVSALISKTFGKLKKSKRNKRSKVQDKQNSLALKVFTKETDQAHFSLAFRSLPLGHKDLPAVRILSTILGRGMSSRLSLIIREELGAAYYVYAQSESLTDHGTFYINAGIDKSRFDEIITRIILECQSMKEKLVENRELEKAKEYTIGTFRLGLELSDDVANFYGGQMVLNQKVKTPEQIIDSIKKVSASDVLRVAKLIFQPQKTNLAVVGPFGGKDIKASVLKKL